MQQQLQQRGQPEQISWARAIIFGVGFFFITAMLIGQIPGYIFTEMIAPSLDTLERALLTLALLLLGGFVLIQVIVLLFDPKPLVPPIIFTVLGAILTIGGLALTVWANFTGCDAKHPTCNQYFPYAETNWNSLLGGKFLWFQAGAVDFVAIGLIILGVGLGMIFYSVLATREQRNPDRRDLGTTPAIRSMLIAGTVLLVVFLVFYTYYNDKGLAAVLFPHNEVWGLKILQLILAIVLGAAIFLTLGAFALRLHYLMRPVRKRTMSALYLVGALGLAQLGVISLIAWAVVYPLLAWIHTWTFIGLNEYLTVCSKPALIPASCSFSEKSGYIVDTLITSGLVVLLFGAIAFWKKNRNLVIIGGFVTVTVIAMATLLLHTGPDQLLVGMLLCGAMLVLATIWTSVARREFAVVGENKLGCIGQWLVVGTCLFIYLGAFAFFSIPDWFPENGPNVPFVSGLIIPAPAQPGQPPNVGQNDALIMLVIMAILAGVQFYFLARNRYKV
ncbi:MAG: hypothetical protein IMW89_06520 [Ktedonobacteraceae bacterium]|nr:hypothetical protein [Ktedonobacteraceae bacterium]